MKIVFCTNTSWYAYNFYSELLSYLLVRGYKVTVLSPDSDYFPALRDIGVDVRQFYLSRKGLNPISDLSSLWDLTRIYLNERPDYVFNFTIKPNVWSGIACQVLGISYSNTISGLGSSFISNGVVKSITACLYKISGRKAKSIFVMNADDHSTVSKIYGKRSGKVIKIPGTGLDLNFYAYKKPKMLDNKIRLVFIGRLLKDKGIFELLNAFSILDRDKYELAIVGDLDIGNPSSISILEIEDFTRKMSNVVYHGFSDDVRRFIEDSHYVILPSYREGLPRVLMEALAIGRPILASSVPGCMDLVNESKAGFTFEAMSVNAIVDTVNSLQHIDALKYSELSYLARKYAENNLGLSVIYDVYSHEVHDA